MLAKYRRKIIIKGQVRGGKNHMMVSKSGHHYPNKKFVEWRNMVMPQVLIQWKGIPAIDKRMRWVFTYTPEDKRKRDMTAVLDAVFHVLEKCNVVADDSLIKNVHYNEMEPDKKNPNIIIEVFYL